MPIRTRATGTAEPIRLLHRHCGEALHLLLELADMTCGLFVKLKWSNSTTLSRPFGDMAHVITDAERDWKRPPGAFCRGRGGRGGCAKDGLSWWASPLWASGLAGDLTLSVLPRTAKLVVLHVIGNEKENLRAEVDSRENCLIVRLFGLFDCHWCYSTFKRRSTTPRT